MEALYAECSDAGIERLPYKTVAANMCVGCARFTSILYSKWDPTVPQELWLAYVTGGFPNPTETYGDSLLLKEDVAYLLDVPARGSAKVERKGAHRATLEVVPQRTFDWLERLKHRDGRESFMLLTKASDLDAATYDAFMSLWVVNRFPEKWAQNPLHDPRKALEVAQLVNR